MTTRRSAVIALATALLVVATSASAAAPADRLIPGQSLEQFLVTGGNTSGIPGSWRTLRLQRLMSTALGSALSHARKEQSRCMKAFPGDKPPWIEGKLFTSSGYEDFTGYSIHPATPEADGRVRISVQFSNDTTDQLVRWDDDYLLILEGGRWRVDDVVYRAGFQFGNPAGASLKDGLLRPGC